MKKTFTKQSMGEPRGRSFFLSLLFFLLFVGFTNTAQAQTGVTCATSKMLTTPISDSLAAGSTAWYSFKANATTEDITVTNTIDSLHSIIHAMKAYTTCSGAVMDSVSEMNDTTVTLALHLTGLTINNIYYVSVSNSCSTCRSGKADYIIKGPNPDYGAFIEVGVDSNFYDTPYTSNAYLGETEGYITYCNSWDTLYIKGSTLTGHDIAYIYRNNVLIDSLLPANDIACGTSSGRCITYPPFVTNHIPGYYSFTLFNPLLGIDIGVGIVMEYPITASFTTAFYCNGDIYTHLIGDSIFSTQNNGNLNTPDFFTWSSSPDAYIVPVNYSDKGSYITNDTGAVYLTPSPYVGIDTLTVIISNACGVDTISETVNIPSNPEPKATITGTDLVCSTSEFEYHVKVNPPAIIEFTGSYQYNWTISGGTITGASNQDSVNVNWSSNLGGTLYVTVNDSANTQGCITTDSIVVRGCCSGSIVLDDDSTSGLGNEIASHPTNFKDIYNNYTISNLSGASALTINGTFTVNRSLRINNCEVILGPNAKIMVAPGVEFRIDNSHFHACSNMWDGIYINGTTSSGGYVLEVQNSSIEDAQHAIVSTNGGYYFVRSSILNKNYQNIVVLPFSGSHQGNIINSTIESYDNATPYTYNPGDNTLRAPFAGQITYQGININYVNSIDVGKTLFGNTFDNVAYGIVSKASTVNVKDNQFSNIQPPLGSTAIVASGNSAGTSALYVGTGVALNANTFTNCNIGVLAQDTINAYISNNTFNMNRNTTSNVCIELFNNYHRTLSVTQNTMRNVSFGVDAVSNLNALANIHDNTISRAATDPHSISTGILTYEAIQSAATHYNIYKNTIGTLSNGIETTNLQGAQINDNAITLNAYSKAPYNEGIIMYNAYKCNTLRNTVTGPTTPNSTDGIRFELGAGGNNIECNTTQYTGNGLFFSGAQTSPDEFVAKNKMENNTNGLVLNSGGDIGPQGGTNAPNDNEWMGTFSNFGTYAISSNGNSSPFYVQAAALYHTTSGYLNVALPIPFHVTGGNFNCLVCLPNHIGPPCPPISPVLSELMAIINDSITYPVFLQQNKWREKLNVFKYLQSDSSLVISSSVVKQFRDSLAQSNMGKLDVINKALSDSNAITTANVAQAQLASAAIVNPDTLEQTSKTVSDILISMQSDGQALPNASQISTLQTIAALCPYEYGTGVYTARAMLSRVDTTHYTNTCEELTNASIEHKHISPASQQDSTGGNVFKLYPNPNNGNMTFAYSLLQSDNGQLVILDMLGQTVKVYNLQQGNNNKLQISESVLKNGVYFYRVLINNVVVKSDKLVIIK